jgi:hypothetical protein
MHNSYLKGQEAVVTRRRQEAQKGFCGHEIFEPVSSLELEVEPTKQLKDLFRLVPHETTPGNLMVKQPSSTFAVCAFVAAGSFALNAGQMQAPTQSRAQTTQSANSRPTEQVIQFAGYEWIVKDSGGNKVGPGPNYFSRDCVRVDENGWLHLKIQQRGGEPHCAEIISRLSFGYGIYHFDVGSNVDGLDPNLVLGLFTWSDQPAFHHRELDIEISQWGKPGNDNVQFVVQPYTHKENIVRFPLTRRLSESFCQFTWLPGRATFVSAKRSDSSKSNALAVIQQHTFDQDIPAAGGENARINLWLFDRRQPLKGLGEVVIRSFKFELTK